MGYKKRIIEDQLARSLSSVGAVVIEGPKACGKTATARRAAASEVLLDVNAAARQALAVDPGIVLNGKTPRLIDEWQTEPDIWNHIRRAVDERGAPGQFILTGSAVPADDITRHSGAGRLTRIRMRPMSLFESGHSSGKISLKGLLDGRPVRSADSGLELADIIERIVCGGWPGLLSRRPSDCMKAVRAYLNEIRRVDIGRLGKRRRNPDKVGRFLHSLARNQATYASGATLAADIGDDDGPLKKETAQEYLDALERLMITEDLPPWAPHLRSKSRVRGLYKRLFTDPSLAVAALKASPESLRNDLQLLGFLFEGLVLRDLRVYAQANDAHVLQYRDNTGMEVDAIVETDDGRWIAFEIKLGVGKAVEEGAASLLKFAKKVDTAKLGKPRALAVIVGSGYGYVRPDGVAVIPIGALGA